jgi:hypothetical protein
MWGIPEPIVSPEEEASAELPAEILENESYRRMDDVELVLRFFAYRQRTSFQKGALSVYLDRYLKQGNKFPLATLVELAAVFEKTAELVYDVLGEQAFWLWRKRTTGWSWFSRPTTVLYDPIMYAFSGFLDRADQLRASKDAVKQSLPAFYEKNYASFEGRYTNLSNVVERNELFMNFLGQQLS